MRTTVEMDAIEYVHGLGRSARAASIAMARAQTRQKNEALARIAELIERMQREILAANQRDLDDNPGLEPALADRLVLDEARVAAMAEGLVQVAALPDPIGEVSDLTYRPSGIQVGKMRVPLGVVGIIYESRPNVTADAAALCLKSGNAAILRGGSEALNSNQAIARCISEGLEGAGLPATAVQAIATADRAAVGALLGMSDYVDVLVPRGGKGLIDRVAREARVPVIKHLDGVCHVYVDATADPAMAEAVAVNAKTQRYGTCNTMETLLVDTAVAPTLLPVLLERYRDAGVECRGCDAARAVAAAQGLPMKAATEDDWYAEYLAPVLAIRIVDGLDEAMAHIRTYGSGHTDAIVTSDYGHARRFVAEVDSSSVMVNASTRFADGFEYGLGAEIGISTDKFHARGPVGLEGLTSQKYVVFGEGHVRS